MTSAAAVRQPGDRLALISLISALYMPIALPLAMALSQLALATWGGPPACPVGVDNCVPPQSPLSRLLALGASGLAVLIIPGVVTAIVSGHLALARMRHQAEPQPRRKLAVWGLILGYGVPLLTVAFYAVALFTGHIDIE
jgi:hypothetical protein